MGDEDAPHRVSLTREDEAHVSGLWLWRTQRAARDELRRESDSVYDFWLSHTEPAELTHTVPLQVIYNSYRAWVGETGSMAVKTKRFRARSSELVEAGLLPGMILEHTDRWVVSGRRAQNRGIRVVSS